MVELFNVFILAVSFGLWRAWNFYEDISFQKSLAVKRYVTGKYYFYKGTITHTAITHIERHFAVYNVFNGDNLLKEVVLFFERSVLTGVFIGLAIIFSTGTFETYFIGGIFPVIYYEISVYSRLDWMYAMILSHLTRTIQSLREKYQISKNLSTALIDCEKHPSIKASIDGIRDMINSNDPAEALEEYNANMSVSYIRMLATMCYLIEDNGDIKNSAGGSVFIDELTVLRQEVDAEQLRIMDIKSAFSGQVLMSFIGFAFFKMFTGSLGGSMPALVVMLNGIYGLFVRAALVLAVVLSFIIVSKLKRPSIVNQRDINTHLYRLSTDFRVRKFLKNFLIPGSERAEDKWTKRFRGALSSKDLYYVYTQKVVLGVALFIIANAVLIQGISSYKTYITNYYGPLTITAQASNIPKTQFQRLKEFESEYVKSGKELKKEELDDKLKSLGGYFKNESDRAKEVDRIMEKRNRISGLKYGPFYFIISMMVALLGWFSPELGLFLRKQLLAYEAQEDILQLQTLIIILHHTKMNAHQALYWMYRQSTVHKYQLMYTYHDYSSGPTEALDRLIWTTSNPELIIMLQKLKAAVFDLSLNEAFSDAYLDKKQSLEVRSRILAETLKKKSTLSGYIATASMVVAIAGGLIIPIIILAIKSYGSIGI